jgi:uncharacterized DUF497 family protein
MMPRANLEKHGIDFLDAQALWKDPDLLEIQGDSLRQLGRTGIFVQEWFRQYFRKRFTL